MNHYYQPGFPVWWLPMAIAAVLPMESTWIMTSQWTAPGKRYEPIKEIVSGFIARRIAQLYGFLTMPPMPPRPQDVEARARAVRVTLSFVEQTDQPVLCMAPEGADMPGGKLSMPPPGAGRFMLLLSGKGLPITPVGVWESGQGQLCVHFGEAFDLKIPTGLSAAQKDCQAATQVMHRLAKVLPNHLRGDFV